MQHAIGLSLLDTFLEQNILGGESVEWLSKFLNDNERNVKKMQGSRNQYEKAYLRKK